MSRKSNTKIAESNNPTSRGRRTQRKVTIGLQFPTALYAGLKTLARERRQTMARLIRKLIAQEIVNSQQRGNP